MCRGTCGNPGPQFPPRGLRRVNDRLDQRLLGCAGAALDVGQPRLSSSWLAAFRPAVRPVEVVAAAVLPAVRVAAGPLSALAAVLLLGAPLRAVVRPTVNVPAGGAVGAGLVARRVVVFVGGADLAAAVVVGADFAAEVAGSRVAVVVWRVPDRAASVAAAAPAAELHAARPQRTP